jgi:tRNA pseudouridine32 synthase/23S rRNA pseudouridine746 synthase
VNQSPPLFEKHIPVETDSMSAVDLLAEATDFSRQRIKQIMQKGAVWVSPASGSERGSEKNAQRLRRAKKVLQPGDTLHLYYDEKILAEEPPTPELIADEGTYSVWYKPYGLRSQGSKWSDHCTIARWVETHLEPQRPAFVVHRLDRAATGLIIIAHKKSTATEFSRMFAKREIEKRYRVVVHGRFPDMPEPYTMAQAIDERPAVSHATLLEYDAEQDRSLLEVNIESGRKHQIRRHLAWAGFPVVGDRLYGSADAKENLQLTACYLSFSDPAAGPIDSPWGQRSKSKKEYRLDDARIVSLSRSIVNGNI